MKKIILILSFALAICTLISCNGTKPDDGKLYFSLPSLPDIGEYTPEVTHERFYDDYTDKIIPRDDYGRLYPYCGNIIVFEEGWMGRRTLEMYGLCTESGVIVTDPVFTDIQKRGDWYILRSKEIRREGDEEYRPYYNFALSKTDGSEYIPLSDTVMSAEFLGDDMISLTTYSERDGNSKIKLCDLKGNTLAEFERTFIREYSGYILLDEYGEESYSGVTDTPDEYGNYRRHILLDSNLNIIAGPADRISCLDGKLYAVQNDSEPYKLYDMQGNELFAKEEIIKFISHIEGVFLIVTENAASLYDYDLNLISSLKLDGTLDPTKLALTNRTILSEIDGRISKFYDFKGNRLDCDIITPLENHYVMIKGAKTHITDKNLNILATLDGKFYADSVDPEAGLIYLSVNNITNAYSLKDFSLVAENVYMLFSYLDFSGFYYRITNLPKTEGGISVPRYEYEIFRADGGEAVYKSEALPSYLDLEEDKYICLRVGDFAVTCDEKFNEIFRVRINTD